MLQVHFRGYSWCMKILVLLQNNLYHLTFGGPPLQTTFSFHMVGKTRSSGYKEFKVVVILVENLKLGYKEIHFFKAYFFFIYLRMLKGRK